MKKYIIIFILLFSYSFSFATNKEYLDFSFGNSLLTTPPTASSQSFCDGSTVADLVATGTDILWYDTLISVTPLSSTVVLVTGNYYATQTIGGIESAKTEVEVTITANTIPLFSPVSSICSGGTLSALPTTSNNGITGTWSPALNNLITTEYTFTPTAGQCASIATLTINVVQVTFSSITTVPTCLNTNAVITMNGLVPNSTADVNYTLAGVPQSIVSVTADGTGTGTFPVFLSAAGQEVVIVSVKRTDISPPSCTLITNYYGNSVLLVVDSFCSNIQATSCGVTLATIDSYVYSSIVSGAQGYRWRVTTLSGSNIGQVQINDTPLRQFKFTNLSTYEYDTLYQVEVSVLKSNVWGTYSPSCNVRTPIATTQLTPCGSTISKMNDWLYCTIVSYTPGYRFRITNSANALDTQIFDYSLRAFRMSDLIGIQYNTIYNVEVAVRNTNGTLMPYGPMCTVKTPPFPTTQIQESQCDYNAPTSATLIYAITNSSAQEYRFKMENTVGYSQVFNSGISNSFTLSNFTGLTAGTTYNVQVSLKIGGNWGPYGKTCSITVPGTGRFVSKKEINGNELFDVVMYPNPFLNEFAININSTSDDGVEIKVYDMVGRLVEQRVINNSEDSQLGNNYASGVYNIIAKQGENIKSFRMIKR